MSASFKPSCTKINRTWKNPPLDVCCSKSRWILRYLWLLPFLLSLNSDQCIWNGATTFSIMTLNIMTLSKTIKKMWHSAHNTTKHIHCLYAEFKAFFVMLSVVMLNVVLLIVVAPSEILDWCWTLISRFLFVFAISVYLSLL